MSKSLDTIFNISLCNDTMNELHSLIMTYFYTRHTPGVKLPIQQIRTLIKELQECLERIETNENSN